MELIIIGINYTTMQNNVINKTANYQNSHSYFDAPSPAVIEETSAAPLR